MHNWDNTTPQRIAVIGSGAAGLTATHLLQRKHHVTLYEKAERLGGHTNTITLTQGPDAGLSIDTGFIVMNHRNYPLLSTLFEQLNVPLQDSDMSFGYYDISSGLQYSGSGLNGLFAQRRNLFRPRFHQLIKRFVVSLRLLPLMLCMAYIPRKTWEIIYPDTNFQKILSNIILFLWVQPSGQRPVMRCSYFLHRIF